ncbi:LPXTG cell wall anchor domain-containing protein [Aerococcus urinae]|uniref:LPXTG cell wall anchor domain-containing protein n=2 Tax=Aerococcus urinae TaxID=1376 RepID=UPI00254F5993|nr:LPXTG cell wall anchor domain-containing protein [Aerococcus urinae]MDK7919855.1 LPXTG cell wall anchor domain-containing protein [Aerococcus urinae]
MIRLFQLGQNKCFTKLKFEQGEIMKTKYFPLATASLVLTALLANEVTVSAQETAPANYTVESNNEVSKEANAANLPTEGNSVSVSDEKATSPSATENEINNHDSSANEEASRPLTRYEKNIKYAEEYTEANKDAILKSYNENKAKLPNTVIVNYPEDIHENIKYYEKENKVVTNDVSKDIEIKELKKDYLDLNQKLDSDLLLESELHLSQKDVKEKTMNAVRVLRAHMWDIDHGLNALENVYDPKTGEKIEGVWVKGERLTERAHAAGINTKEDYINSIQWDRDLEDTAIQNLAEIVNRYGFYENENFNYSKPDSNKFSIVDNFFNLENKSDFNFENLLLNNFIYPKINEHNKKRGNYNPNEYKSIGNIINLLLDPYNKSLALASNIRWNGYSNIVALASPTPSKNNSSSDYTGLKIAIVNGDHNRVENYEVTLPDKLYENTSRKLNIHVGFSNAEKQKIYGYTFNGKITLMNPEILEIDDQGIIHAKQAGVTDIILSINGIVQRKKLEVLPRPNAKDTIYYDVESHYEDTEYRANPKMQLGEEKVIQEYKPDINYYVDRLIKDKNGIIEVQTEKFLTIPGSKKIIEYGTKELEEKHPEKVEPEVPDEKPANEAKPEENNSPNNSIGVIFGRPYENNPGYIELLPGYYVQLEPEHEDQTIRINEKEFETEIRTSKDLRAGEYRIIQQGQNAYIALTNRVYKDHLGNVLKTQELGRQRVEGKPLIIEVGVESNGQPTASIDEPETTMPSNDNSNNKKKLPEHELEDNSSPSTEHKPVEEISIHVDSTSDNKEVHDREGENNSSSSTIIKPLEENSIKVSPTLDSRVEETSTSSISKEFPRSVGSAKIEGDSIDLVTPEVAKIDETRGEERVLAPSDTISKHLSKKSPKEHLSAPLSNSEIHSSTKGQDANNPVLATYTKDIYEDSQNYRHAQQVASKLPATGTMDNKLSLAIGLTTVLTGLLSFKVSRRRN